MGLKNAGINRSLLLWTLSCMLIVSAIYWQVIGFDFVSDDTILLWTGGYYRGGNIFQAIWANFPISESYFRPLVVSSFALDLYIFDNKPSFMHLHNALFHLGSSLLVGALVAQVLYRNNHIVSGFFPAVAMLLFGLHPMLVEPASWISGRFDVYVTFWILLLLNLDFILPNKICRIASAFFLFLCAAMSKEMAAPFPLVYLLIRMWALGSEQSLSSRYKILLSDGSLLVAVSMILSGILYVGLRYSALGYVLQHHDPVVISEHFGNHLQHLLLVGKTAGTYLLYVIAGGAYISPVHYQAFPIGVNDMGAWVGLLTLMLAVVISALMIIKEKSAGYILPVFFIALSPVLNITFWPNTEDLVQERFMSLPLALLVFMLTATLALDFYGGYKEKLVGSGVGLSKIMIGTMILVVLINSAISYAGISIWKDSMSLWTWAFHRVPQSAYVNTNLAVAYRLQGDYVKSKEFADSANRLAPGERSGDYTLAAIAVSEGRNEEAISIVDRHIDGNLKITRDQLLELLHAKAMALFNVGRNNEAADILVELLRHNREDQLSALLIGDIYNKNGLEKKANACWAMALKEMPDSEIRKRFSDGNNHLEKIILMAEGESCIE